jgi:hypothetical protein
VQAQRLVWALVASAVAASVAGMAAQGKPQVYRGLEVSVAKVERATSVSLTDCPPGANTQRGVIKPGDPMEFAAVTVDFKVLPAFKPGPLAKPTITDEAGKVYNTAQSFADVGGTPGFTCTFAFRVPTGRKVRRFTLDSLSIDIAAMAP